jgi:site-specific DNA recombinase
MKKAIGYIRVSTMAQVTEGVSLQAQRAKIEAWCLINDYELTALYADEGISGTKSDRDGITSALEDVTAGSALVVASLSRLTRSTKDMIIFAETLAKRGADLISLTEKIDTTTAAGKMVFRMMGVLNEFERDQVSERTKAALAYKKSNNQAYNHEPYGYVRKGNDFVENKAEITAIELIKKQRAAGKSIRQIVAILNKKGIAPKKSAQWNPSSVHYLLKRAA